MCARKRKKEALCDPARRGDLTFEPNADRVSTSVSQRRDPIGRARRPTQRSLIHLRVIRVYRLKRVRTCRRGVCDYELAAVKVNNGYCMHLWRGVRQPREKGHAELGTVAFASLTPPCCGPHLRQVLTNYASRD